MRQFAGFPSRSQFTPLPRIFVSLLMPRMDDIYELKTVIHFFDLLSRKRGYPRFVAYGELLEDRGLAASLRESGKPPEEALRDALDRATKRGIMLRISVATDTARDDVYFLNAESERKVVARIQRGEMALKGLKPIVTAGVAGERPPDIFTLYEENIGMLTPIIADELQEAEKAYPAEWIRDAVREAVAANKRRWSYISRILETWAAEGKRDGTHFGHPQKTDPDKYIKGRYGDRVQR